MKRYHFLPPDNSHERLGVLSRPAVSGVSRSGLEYVNIGTQEETALETYFVMLSKFNFERAKEQCVSLPVQH